MRTSADVIGGLNRETSEGKGRGFWKNEMGVEVVDEVMEPEAEVVTWTELALKW
jgi:hypothetical protein